MFQPHLPVRLPCYDLAPVTSFTLGRSSRLRTSGTPGSHGLTVEGKGYKDGQTYGLALNKQFDGFKPYLAAQYARNSLSVGKKPLLVFKAVEAKHPNTKGINGIAIITGTDVSCFSGTFKAAVQYFHGKNEGAEDKDKLKRLIFSIGQEYPLSKRTVLYAGTNWGKSEAKAHGDRKSTRLNSSHTRPSRMPSSA